MFLAGTTRNVVSIVTVDDRQIGSGKPGPVFKRLEAAFDKMLADWLAVTAV
jgi:branched-subunit amino acid aminotransferase/4-amino-4-deoxychorismate lyase